MIFDKLCGVAERFLPDAADFLARARLFVYDKPAHAITGAMEPERGKWLQENFFLPFPVVAVEDPGSCILYADTESDARGMAVARRFFECLPLKANPAAYRDGARVPTGKNLDLIPDGAVVVSAGWIALEQPDPGKRFRVGGSVEWVTGATKHAISFRESGGDLSQQLFESALRNAAVGLEELMLLNAPDRFVLEIAPVKSRARSEKAAKILRSDDRPRYTLLRPDEIRTVMRLPVAPAGERGSPTPHERRAHTRTLRSERYKDARGKTVIVPATWVGPSEATHAGKRYRVMLDI